MLTDHQTYETRTVVLAMGAAHRMLGVPGEQELSGMGVSYCATCDGAFFRGRSVAVVGGGDVALEDALFLARGCEKVYLIHRRDQFRGAAILQQRVLETENIEPVYDTVVEEICGEDAVESLQLYNKKEDKRSSLAVQGVFIAVGIVPNTGQIKGLPDLDEGGYIIAGEDGVTSIPGIFAAGDIRTKRCARSSRPRPTEPTPLPPPSVISMSIRLQKKRRIALRGLTERTLCDIMTIVM